MHERSDGIPLHVEELLAAIDEDALTPQSGVAVRSAAVPDTLGDAVLSRARQLAPRTRQVASALMLLRGDDHKYLRYLAIVVSTVEFLLSLLMLRFVHAGEAGYRRRRRCPCRGIWND